MRHRVAGKKLGRTTAHKKAMFRNMVTSLILHDRIETTLPKAKELRRWADRMVTLAKKNTVAARREAMMVLKDRAALQKLFTTLVDRYKSRAGGYTRVLKLGYRHGDNAAMAIIEYLSAEAKKVTKSTEGKTKSKAKAAPKSAKGGSASGGKTPAKKATKKTETKKAKPAKKAPAVKKAPAKKKTTTAKKKTSK